MKHTPAPWNIEYQDNEYHNGGHIQITVNQPGRGYKFIMQDYNGKGIETSEANAKVICAAPDMLYVLMLEEELNTTGEVIHEGQTYRRGERKISLIIYGLKQEAIFKATL